ESYDEAEAINGEIEKEKAVVSEEEKRFQNKKQEVDAEVKTIEARIKELEGQRASFTDIDPNIKARYERLLPHKNGLAIVPVAAGNSCGGCHMNVTHQTINQIKMNEELVVCEMCQRILYVEDAEN
ncbi:MAG: hypothetical protein KC618_03585, partial [Candidatus Omnitrophica bacterium]|nr:hypothetical protein [Candidatus Omnitrophota bacterium]